MSHENHSPIDYGTGRKKLSVYLIGIVLCVVLTLIPFYLVMHSPLAQGSTLIAIYGLAVLQFIVQVICFLRLNAKTPQAQTNLMAFWFAIVILVVVIGGSLWIMWNLNYRMM